MFGSHLKINKVKFNSIFLIISLVVLDQLSKFFIEKNFTLYESYEFFSFFNITFVVNYGFAFGMFNDPNSNQLIIMLLIALVILYLSVLFLQSESKIVKFSFTMILAGAIGNLLDRIIRGYVVDFMDFYISKYHWPAFNFADTYISIGFIFILISILLGKKI